MRGSKIPISILVVIHTQNLQVLLLERADHPGYWQSVTGSQNRGESLEETARREVREETGLTPAAHSLQDWHIENRYEIFAEWRHRYPPGVTHNTEHVFGMMVPAPVPVRLTRREHLNYAWLPFREAAGRCFSWSNRDAILRLPRFVSGGPGPREDQGGG